MWRSSVDLQVLQKSYKGHKFILCKIDEVTSYLITVPIYQSRSEEIVNALIDNTISKYCIPDNIIMDQDSAFMASLMNYLFKKFDTKSKTIGSYNHQSLQTEHGRKSWCTILPKHLTGSGQMWPKYLTLAMFAIDTINHVNFTNYSPYELVSVENQTTIGSRDKS